MKNIFPKRNKQKENSIRYVWNSVCVCVSHNEKQRMIMKTKIIGDFHTHNQENKKHKTQKIQIKNTTHYILNKKIYKIEYIF